MSKKAGLHRRHEPADQPVRSRPPSTTEAGDDKKSATDDALDEALMGTFPASDPVSFESTLIARRRARQG
jgi:hypothetical protein